MTCNRVVSETSRTARIKSYSGKNRFQDELVAYEFIHARGQKKLIYLDYFLVADAVTYANIERIVRHSFGLAAKLNVLHKEADKLFCGLSLSDKSGTADPWEHHRERSRAGFDRVIEFIQQAKIFWVVRELPTGGHMNLRCTVSWRIDD